MSKKSGKKVFGRLNVEKAQKKYQDVVTGYWADDATEEGSGTWNIDNRPDIQGFWLENYSGPSASLFVDSNKNGIFDYNDQYVGFAKTTDADPGGFGRWNWSTGARMGDVFASTGTDIGKIYLESTSFLG